MVQSIIIYLVRCNNLLLCQKHYNGIALIIELLQIENMQKYTTIKKKIILTHKCLLYLRDTISIDDGTCAREVLIHRWIA